MIDQLVEIGNAIWAWFGNEDNQSRAVAIATVVGTLLAVAGVILGAVWGVLRFFFPKRPEGNAPPSIPTGELLTMDQHLTILQKREDQLEAKLASAHEEEKTQLTAQIAELKSQIANPEKSLAEARERIADLEALLDREGNHIGGDRIREAKTALEQGDYSIADDIFAEIEARNELAVQETARAAYGRGEVAEAEVRWHDAYTHYKRAAELSPTTQHLRKASDYAERSGLYKIAARFSGEFVALARTSDDQQLLSAALNEHAINNGKLGRSEEAEALYREALEIGRATIGERHPGYAIDLNNLAGAVQAQGRYAEAEGLYREALDITRATLGEGHPAYAIRLNNLALVAQAQGRYAEAEGLYREALKIGRATLGEGHPAYATRLNNLAGVVKAQGRYDEAEGLYREALEIGRATIGEKHPNYAIHLNNLAGVVQAQGRYGEAEGLYREALEIDRATIGEGHPDYGVHLVNLGSLLGKGGRVDEAREMLEQALAIFRATLPEDHPHIATVQSHLDALPTP
ncbi:tetratricopeptide repeat protein [Roseovarius sp. D22-M7]|uniref:tetratricopeptide repeat protein n=1 Tax=Roseovarius sp. D22-M7 TaxID=3127116 RepID=UPI00300FA7C1